MLSAAQSESHISGVSRRRRRADRSGGDTHASRKVVTRTQAARQATQRHHRPKDVLDNNWATFEINGSSSLRKRVPKSARLNYWHESDFVLEVPGVRSLLVEWLNALSAVRR